jgi:hypothetical protein
VFDRGLPVSTPSLTPTLELWLLFLVLGWRRVSSLGIITDRKVLVPS